MPARRSWKVAAWSLSATVWAIAALTGFLALSVYGSNPGQPSTPPGSWPTGTSIARVADCATLLVFLHPYCPCSQATVSELARLVRAAGKSVRATVIILGSIGTAKAEDTAMWHASRQIPTVQVICDIDAAETRRFAARTSGAALLYDRDGKLRFHGGLTVARGQAGDNPGADSVLALLRGEPGLPSTPVFGCPLFDPVASQACSSTAEGQTCHK